MDHVFDDGYYRSRIVSHAPTGEVGHIFEQKDRDVILERNARLRNNPHALNDLSFGRQVASIPFEDWQYFLQKNPNYRHMDKKEKEVCMMNFLKFDPIGQACCVQDPTYKTKTKFHVVGR